MFDGHKDAVGQHAAVVVPQIVPAIVVDAVCAERLPVAAQQALFAFAALGGCPRLGEELGQVLGSEMGAGAAHCGEYLSQRTSRSIVDHL